MRSWGKHFILVFDSFALRIYFLTFGSYRINIPCENRDPKLRLQIADDEILFYSCANKKNDFHVEKNYDWSSDLMSKKWNAKKALQALAKRENEMVCDLLLDQAIFSGLGNIMKNETRFRLRLHPETRYANLSTEQKQGFVRGARVYARLFYKWKKLNVLKKSWQVFRKAKCPCCA